MDFTALMFGISIIAILLFSGFTIAVQVLRERSLLAIVALTCSFGIAASMVLTNTLGYVLPIRVAFLVTFVILSFLSVILWLFPGENSIPSIETPPPFVMWTLGILSLVGAFTTARFSGSDPWAWVYYPLAATIMEGNFPIREPISPWNIAGYHYGPALLAAAFSSLTGFSLAVSYSIQPFFGIFGSIFAAAALLRHIGQSWKGVLLGSILAITASGFIWVKGIWFLRDLFQHFVLGHVLAHPFRGLAPTFGTNLAPSLLMVFGSRSYTLGIPLLYSLLYGLKRLFEIDGWRMIVWALICLLLSLAMALTIETSLVLFLPAIVAYVSVLWLLARRSEESPRTWKRVALLSAAVFVPALLIAIVQGGILTAARTQSLLGPSAFRFGFDGRIRYHSTGASVGVWEWPFLRDFGFPFLLFPFACIFFWRRRTTMSFALFLCIFAFIHFAVPFLVRYEVLLGAYQFLRIGYIFVSLSSLLIGAVIAQTLLQNKNRLRQVLGLLVVLSMVLASVFYTVTRITIPTMRLEAAPLFATMPPVSHEQEALYEWVRRNTGIDDYFYIRTISEEARYSEYEEGEQRDRILFMTYTGRFTIGPILWSAFPHQKIQWLERIENSCDLTAFDVLEIRYLVVETAERARWFAEHCTPSHWHLAYDGGGSTKPYPHIYKRTQAGQQGS